MTTLTDRQLAALSTAVVALNDMAAIVEGQTPAEIGLVPSGPDAVAAEAVRQKEAAGVPDEPRQPSGNEPGSS